MPSNPSILSQHADLHLRRGVDVQVTWPPGTPDTPALLVVLAGESPGAAIWHELCLRIPAVVLAVPTTRFDQACEALEWGADHADELGADPRRLLLAADHGGAGLMAALARHARDRGWPPIAHHVLVDPELDAARVDQLVGLLSSISLPEPTPAGTRVASGPGSRGRSAGPARRTGARR